MCLVFQMNRRENGNNFYAFQPCNVNKQFPLLLLLRMENIHGRDASDVENHFQFSDVSSVIPLHSSLDILAHISPKTTIVNSYQ